MKRIRILILEDDLQTLAKILDGLYRLEERLTNAENPKEIAVTVLSEYTQVDEYINASRNPQFDIVLLDRDCKAGGSFHTLSMAKIGVEKIVAISSIPQYNEEARKRGIIRIVHKDYSKLSYFTERLCRQIEEMTLEN